MGLAFCEFGVREEVEMGYGWVGLDLHVIADDLERVLVVVPRGDHRCGHALGALDALDEREKR